MAGFIALGNANVKWFLSIDRIDLPLEVLNNGKNVYRSITIDGEEVEFTQGFGIKDTRNSTELVHKLRKEKPNDERRDRKIFLSAYNLLKGSIKTDIERLTKILTITIAMPESQLSADVANRIVESLDNYT